MRRFARTFAVTNETRILDVGGTPFNWSLLDVHPRVTIVNMPRAREAFNAQFRSVFADGRALPFPDRSFDIVFSNSVIEHVGDPESQRQFANEIARVGQSYWVQTPNRSFPVEPHLLTPFLHFLPAALQRRIARKFTVWSLIERPTPDRWEFYIEHYLRDIRLLDARELERLFRGAGIVRERLCGLTKSLIAVRTLQDRRRQ
jgi:ubiquinone/menaquinone biosynthesis C-methylase UbiE